MKMTKVYFDVLVASLRTTAVAYETYAAEAKKKNSSYDEMRFLKIAASCANLSNRIDTGMCDMGLGELGLARASLDFAQVAHTAKASDARAAGKHKEAEQELQFVQVVGELRQRFAGANPFG